MSIINKLDSQLKEIERILREDLQKGLVTHNFKICQDEVKFLDVPELKKYLTENEVKNTIVLESIVKRCIAIIELWNIDFENLPDNTLGESFKFIDEKSGKYLNTTLNFHTLYLKPEKIISFERIESKNEFLNDYKYKNFTASKIASICSTIYSWITKSFPKINIEFSPKYYLFQYKENSRFFLNGITGNFSGMKSKDFKRKLKKYLFKFRCVFELLDNPEKNRLKNNILEHLQKIVENNKNTFKIREDLYEAIKLIESDFNEVLTPTDMEKPDNVKDKHPKHEPNLWSSECYKLFTYLFDNYFEKKTKRQLTNIWFYLNEYDQVKYNFKATKDKYKDFINKNYNIKITNFEKAQVKYHKEYGTMNEHRINYEDNF